jgi:putative RecB family exonuclease
MMVEPLTSGSTSLPTDESGSPAEALDGAPTGDSPANRDTPSTGTVPRPSPADEALEDSRRRPSLSPSRAADFKTCPLLYRLRSIDRIPEAPTPDQLRGTLVHAVLERLFDEPAAGRTPATAAALVTPQWERLLSEIPELAGVVTDEELTEFLSSTHGLLAGYFAMEDPRRLAPAEREYLVSAEVDDGRLQLRGYVDRLDIAPDGAIRVVDYKTGGAPREAFEARALFQLKFYALVLWRTRGVVPAVLRLVYLKDAEICDFTPDAEELERFERTLIALWAAIAKAREAREFQPKPSRLCAWCAHQSRCPEFGGTPPPYPDETELDVSLAAASVAIEPAD